MQSLQRQEPIGFLIAVARRRIKQAVAARVGGLGLSPQQFWVLLRVLESDGPSLRELAAMARIDQPTASRVVTALVRRKLVQTRVDPRDRRRLRLVATAAGEALRPGVAAAAREVRGAVKAGFSPAEVEALRTGLRRVIGNLEGLATRADRGTKPPRRGKGAA